MKLPNDFRRQRISDEAKARRQQILVRLSTANILRVSLNEYGSNRTKARDRKATDTIVTLGAGSEYSHVVADNDGRGPSENIAKEIRLELRQENPRGVYYDGLFGGAVHRFISSVVWSKMVGPDAGREMCPRGRCRWNSICGPRRPGARCGTAAPSRRRA